MPEPRFVMVSEEFGHPIYVGPTEGHGVPNLTDRKEEAEVWKEKDRHSVKLSYYRTVTGLNLCWKLIKE